MNVNEQAEALGRALSETDIFKRYIFGTSKTNLKEQPEEYCKEHKRPE